MSRSHRILVIGSTIAVIMAGGLVYANATSGDTDEQYCRTPAGYIRLSLTGECRRKEVPVELPTADEYNELNSKVESMNAETNQLRDDLAAVQTRVRNLPDGFTVINGYFLYPGVDAQGANLANADLSGLNLAGVNLANADLRCANLRDVDFTGANLRTARIGCADIEGARFGGANLSYIQSGRVSGRPAEIPEGWRLVNGYFVGREADLGLADLSEANLANVDLYGANLWAANLKGANLEGANLEGAGLGRVSSGGVSGRPAEMPEGWRLTNGYLVGSGANLYLANLANADLSGLNLSETDLNGADLAGANLANTNLTWAQLSEANLNNANLNNANLTHAYLQGANLVGANLTFSILWHTNLTFVNIEGVRLQGADVVKPVSGGIIGTPTSLPDGWSLVDGTLVNP